MDGVETMMDNLQFQVQKQPFYQVHQKDLKDLQDRLQQQEVTL